MAKKAFFHKTTITNGHGSNTYVYPAQRQIDVVIALQSSTEKVVVESSKWLPVEIMFGPEGVYFRANDHFDYFEGNYGFDYLVNQFNPDYQSAINYFNDNGM